MQASQDALATEQAAHKVTSEAFEAFKKEPGAKHTNVPKDEDDYNGASAPKSQIEIDEEKARAEGEKISKHINN